MIKAGRLRHRVDVQRRSETADEYGEHQNAWTTILCCRASIEPLRGTETYPSSMEYEQVECRIRMRYQTELRELAARDRITCGDDIYEIVSVRVPWEAGREMEVMCMRGTRDGI